MMLILTDVGFLRRYLDKMAPNLPIFQSVFAEQWQELPPVMHKHYANRPYCDDVVTVEGKMDVEFGWLVRLLSPFLRVFGALVPYQGKDIPVTVQFRSEPDSAAYCLDRTFNFTNKKPYVFYSKMVVIKRDIIVEFMKYGIGWKHCYSYNDDKVKLEHLGYVWKIFGRIIPIPLGLFLGCGYAEEEALDQNNFRMKMNITHPMFGKMYEYKGRFKIIGDR